MGSTSKKTSKVVFCFQFTKSFDLIYHIKDSFIFETIPMKMRNNGGRVQNMSFEVFFEALIPWRLRLIHWYVLQHFFEKTAGFGRQKQKGAPLVEGKKINQSTSKRAGSAKKCRVGGATAMAGCGGRGGVDGGKIGSTRASFSSVTRLKRDMLPPFDEIK
jgi:hypothetical protein